MLTSFGVARYAVGDFFEQATASVSGAVRLRTDHRCKVCPDLQQSPRLFFECKGVGKNGSIIIYKGRVEKYEQFVQDTSARIVYWVWQHNFPVKSAVSYNQLHGELTQSTFRLLVFDERMLRSAIGEKIPRVVNSGATKAGNRLGYGNEAKGYGIGWLLRVNWFAERCQQLPNRLNFSTGLHHFRNVQVFVSSDEFIPFIFPDKQQGSLFQ